MREQPREPTPIHRKARDRFLETYDELDYEDREIVQIFLRRWSFMEASRHRQGQQVKVRILGKMAG